MRRVIASLAVALGIAAWAVPGGAAATTIDVNTTADTVANDGHCSLREAVTAANTDTPSGAAPGECPAGSGADTINLPAAASPYKLTRPGKGDNNNLVGDIDINSNLSIIGAGAATTTVDANGLDRAFDVKVNRFVTLQGMTITGGAAPNGSDGTNRTGGNGTGSNQGATGTGTDGQPGEAGGGIRSAGSLTIIDCVITGNVAGNGGTGGIGTGGTGGPGGGDGGTGVGGSGGAGGAGGGIFSSGPLTLTRVSVTNDVSGDGGATGAGVGGAGGGSGQGGTGVSVAGGDGGGGGGVFVTGDALSITASTISGNKTGHGGAGASGVGGTGGTGAIGGTGVGGVGGNGGSGGGVGSGAGFSLPGGPTTLVDSRISGNSTGGGGVAGQGVGGTGGAGSGTGAGGAGGTAVATVAGSGGSGGALFQLGDALTASGDTFDGNTLGAGGNGAAGIGGNGGTGGGTAGTGGAGGLGIGAVGGSGGSGAGLDVIAGAAPNAANVTNVTVSANTAGAAGVGGAGQGGHGGTGGAGGGNGGKGGDGIGITGGNGGSGGGTATGSTGETLTLTHATITGNSGRTGGAGGPGVAGAGGSGTGGGSTGASGAPTPGTSGTAGNGGIFNRGTTTLRNSIVSGNGLPSCAGSPAVADGGHDISFGDATCPGAHADPTLGTLADNGGPTPTEALLAGSPAIDAVPSTGAGCAATDQRGVSRPHGAGCDVGAYEVAAPDATTGGATGVTTTGATIQGVLNPNGKSASWHFEFGTTTAYGSSTPVQTASGTSPGPVSAVLGGLAPNTPIHYRLVATNADGTSAGQDATFTTAPLPPITVPDRTPPIFISASLSPATFAVNPRGPAVAPVPKRRRPPKGTTIRYRLTEAARVVFTVERSLPGRRAGRRCVKPTRANRHRRACTRFSRIGRFAALAHVGANTKKFPGRIGRRSLAPARYRLTLVATDAARNASKPRRLAFRVVRP